ncbi:MAG: hypothetical protein HS101_01135 [Planctomycetia bacterium]|jgi:hypothetical protein|nr:hypothetical protein [Planctomycetia bacterium]MCC7315682.1 hypothetical protein [Planctomycetota bacterium]OQZ01622.1 MAG: hypothetical protein B6D36_13940 [Planctomycetes bacterium UTPLA1]
MRTKEVGTTHPRAECDLDEILADKRMLSEGCPNVQPIAQLPKSSPCQPEKSASETEKERQ